MSSYSLSLEGNDGDIIHVDATVPMMHPEQCTFAVSQPLYPSCSAHFAGKERSMGSPLIDKLFDLGVVNDVVVAHDTLTINLRDELRDEAGWEHHIPRVGAVIQDVLRSGKDAIAPAVTKSLLPPEELRARVQKVLDELINPAIAAHGGFVNLLNVANNTVYLQFSGGCHGCGMIAVTLKYGVERAIREQVPEAGEILDTTDHAAGRNPYYGRTSK